MTAIDSHQHFSGHCLKGEMQVFTSSTESEFIRRAFFEFVMKNDEIPDGRHSLSRRLLLPKGSIEVLRSERRPSLVIVKGV